MSRLSESEIQSLFDFTRKKYVRYKDVQIELVDHLASAIEELREKDPEIGFVKALYQVYEGFGIFGFAKIVEAKEKAMSRFWRKRIWRMFLGYFKPPLVFGTIGSMIFLYQVLYFGLLPMRSFVISASILFFSCVVYSMYVNNTKDEKIQDFLYLKSYYGISLAVLCLPFYLITIVMDFFNYANQLHPDIQLAIASIFFPICFILIYILAFKIPGLLKREFNVKYEHILSTS